MKIYLPELNIYADVLDTVNSFYMNDDREYEKRIHRFKHFEWNIGLSWEALLTWDSIHREIMLNKVKPSNATFEQFIEYHDKFCNFSHVTDDVTGDLYITRNGKTVATISFHSDKETDDHIRKSILTAL